jgi:hypothetical protein
MSKMIAAADASALALAGKSSSSEIETTYDGELSARSLAQGVGWLRDAGIKDDAIQQVFDGKPLPRVEYEAVKQLQIERHSDSAWVAKLMNGDHEAKRQQMLMSVALNAGFQEAT